MRRIFALNGSPRTAGNTSFLLKAFLDGAKSNDVQIDQVHTHESNVKYCNGCLRCNLIKRCSINGDEWPIISQYILESDILVIAAPVYFHHLPASVKTILDRFRSFVKVTITEKSINHRAWHEWNKDIVLILTMGSSDNADAKPVMDLFKYMVKMLGPKNKLHIINANRLAVIKQINFSKDELETLYEKLMLPVHLSEKDSKINELKLDECFDLGKKLSS